MGRRLYVAQRRPRQPAGMVRRHGRSPAALCLAMMAWLATPLPARAASLYPIDQRYATIQFLVSALGMFDVTGRFTRFHGEVVFDAGHPEHTRIDVAIDANAVTMPLPDQVALLLSPEYFDATQYPTERFVSSSIQSLSPSHYVVHGSLSIRGITRPQELDAVVIDHHLDSAGGFDTADLTVTGKLKRSDFGMAANSVMLSDTVRLRIHIRLKVDTLASNE